MIWRHLLGRRGERAAARHLRRQRCRVLWRNYRCPAGEIDLIVLDDDTIVFVEVKTHSGEAHSSQRPTVPHRQRRRIEQAARCFVQQFALHHRPCRFDIVLVSRPKRGKAVIEHFKDAFAPRGGT